MAEKLDMTNINMLNAVRQTMSVDTVTEFLWQREKILPILRKH